MCNLSSKASNANQLKFSPEAIKPSTDYSAYINYLHAYNILNSCHRLHALNHIPRFNNNKNQNYSKFIALLFFYLHPEIRFNVLINTS